MSRISPATCAAVTVVRTMAESAPDGEVYPLDPDEGPTVWVNPEAGNKYTVKLLVGQDPENPRKDIVLSHGEIERLVEVLDL